MKLALINVTLNVKDQQDKAKKEMERIKAEHERMMKMAEATQAQTNENLQQQRKEGVKLLISIKKAHKVWQVVRKMYDEEPGFNADPIGELGGHIVVCKDILVNQGERAANDDKE